MKFSRWMGWKHRGLLMWKPHKRQSVLMKRVYSDLQGGWRDVGMGGAPVFLIVRGLTEQTEPGTKRMFVSSFAPKQHLITQGFCCLSTHQLGTFSCVLCVWVCVCMCACYTCGCVCMFVLLCILYVFLHVSECVCVCVCLCVCPGRF